MRRFATPFLFRLRMSFTTNVKKRPGESGRQELPQARCSLIAVQRAGCNIQRESLPFRAIRLRFNSVEAEKDDTCTQCDALVSINERMVSAEVKKIRRGYFFPIRIRRLAAKDGLRHRNSRFQQCHIANPAGPSKPCNDFGMDLPHDFHVKMKTIIQARRHASFFIVPA